MRSPDNELSAHTIIRPKRLRLIKRSPQLLTPKEDQGLTPSPVLAHLDEEDWHPGM